MYSKSKDLVVTVTHATLGALASDVARSCKSSVCTMSLVYIVIVN